MDIGERIRELRLEAGITQRQLSVALGVAASFVCVVESGAKPFPRRLIAKLPRAIRVPILDAEIAELIALRKI